MKRIAAGRRAVLGVLVFLGAAPPAAAQSNVRVVLTEVVDDRISEGMATGGLVLVMNLEGEGLDAVKSARVRLQDAKDDTGRSLLGTKSPKPDFSDRNSNGGNIQVALDNPPRGATFVRVSGTADLFVPGRDPNSVVKVPGFAARPEKPLAAKGLKAAKLVVKVLPRAKYIEERKKMRLDDRKIALIRAEGKERGMKDEEVDALVEMAKAFDEVGEADFPQNGLFLEIGRPGDEKIQDLWLETAAGERVETGGSQSRSEEEVVLRQLTLKEPLPKDAVLVFSLFTDKAIVPVPFDLKEVPLP